MPIELLIQATNLPAFTLVLSRVVGLLISAPLISTSTIPFQIRTGLMLGVGILLFPLVGSQAPANLSMMDALGGSLGELAVGLGIGLSLQVILSGLFLAGYLLGQQAGISLGQVYNPTLEEESSVLADLYSMCGLACIFITGVHRACFRGLMDSYESIPLLSPLQAESMVVLLQSLMTSAFILGLRLAGPGLIALVMLELVLGVLSRAMPQMNILTVGFSFRALVALTIVGVGLAVSDDLIVSGFDEGWGEVASGWLHRG